MQAHRSILLKSCHLSCTALQKSAKENDDKRNNE